MWPFSVGRPGPSVASEACRTSVARWARARLSASVGRAAIELVHCPALRRGVATGRSGPGLMRNGTLWEVPMRNRLAATLGVAAIVVAACGTGTASNAPEGSATGSAAPPATQAPPPSVAVPCPAHAATTMARRPAWRRVDSHWDLHNVSSTVASRRTGQWQPRAEARAVHKLDGRASNRCGWSTMEECASLNAARGRGRPTEKGHIRPIRGEGKKPTASVRRTVAQSGDGRQDTRISEGCLLAGGHVRRFVQPARRVQPGGGRRQGRGRSGTPAGGGTAERVTSPRLTTAPGGRYRGGRRRGRAPRSGGAPCRLRPSGGIRRGRQPLDNHHRGSGRRSWRR